MFNRKLCSFEHEVFLILWVVDFHYVEKTVVYKLFEAHKERIKLFKDGLSERKVSFTTP